jgi:hypothetical protein
MVNESNAQTASGSSNEAPANTTLNVSESRRSITKPALSATRIVPDQIAEPSATEKRTRMREELLDHLLIFSHALSSDMSIYLDHLFVGGKRFADHMAAKYSYDLDTPVIEKYMAEVKEISERYGYSIRHSPKSKATEDSMTHDESIQIQREAHTRHQLLMTAPRCWMELRAKLNISSAERYQSVTVKAPRCDLEVEFSQDHPHVTYEIKNTSTGITPCYGTFSFVLLDDILCLCLEAGPGNRPFDRTGVPLTVDEVAEFLLGKLV